MTYAFWASIALILYAYIGYPVYLCLRRGWRNLPVQKTPFEPTISILIAAHNEAHNIACKLENLASLDYPRRKIQIVIALDGCTDNTQEIIESFHKLPVTIAVVPEQRGKAVAVNAGLEKCTGQIVVFADARQQIEPGAIRSLLANFSDPGVGCASGELMIGDASSEATGYGLYWRIEKTVRRLESARGSVIGATGAFYAVRRDLIVSLPEGLLLDDVYQPMHVIKAGKRVVFESEARAWDLPASDAKAEFRRKVRTLTGNYQLLQLAPWLLRGANPARFEFISHKLLRLLVPFALIGVFVTSGLIPSVTYRTALLAQMVFYGLALLKILKIRLGALARIAEPASAFVVLNAAATVAAFEFIFRRHALATLWRTTTSAADMPIGPASAVEERVLVASATGASTTARTGAGR